MYNALMKAMEERDMSHAKLAAAEVLHVHELEQQRKLNTRLQAEVEVLRMEKTSSDSDQEKRLHHQMQMQQNSDDELMSLCQQLAGEISARTSASLEVDRLKEGRQIDLEQHQNEIRALQEEIASLRKALDEERTETKSVKSELSRWRRSYEDMVEEELPVSS
jgi:chromosome segregation ATPase